MADDRPRPANWGRRLLIGLVVALGLALFGGVLWWSHHQAALAGERGEQMTLALDSVDELKLEAADRVPYEILVEPVHA